MDSEHLIYKNFAEMMVNTFHDFVCKLENMESPIIDENFLMKLHKVHTVLQKLFTKCDRLPCMMFGDSNDTILNMNGRTATNEHVVSKPSSSVKITANQHIAEIQQNTDASVDDFFQKTLMYTAKEVVDSEDECDREVITNPLSMKNLFTSDYPDNLEIDAIHQPLENTIQSDSDIVFSTKRDLSPVVDIKIPRIEPDATNDFDLCPGIFKITEDVYQCKLCLVKNLPKNNIRTHVNGRQHKNALMKSSSREISPSKSKDILAVVKDCDENLVKGKDGLLLIVSKEMFTCTLCKTDVYSESNLRQHVEGSKHKKNLMSQN